MRGIAGSRQSRRIRLYAGWTPHDYCSSGSDLALEACVQAGPWHRIPPRVTPNGADSPAIHHTWPSQQVQRFCQKRVIEHVKGHPDTAEHITGIGVGDNGQAGKVDGDQTGIRGLVTARLLFVGELPLSQNVRSGNPLAQNSTEGTPKPERAHPLSVTPMPLVSECLTASIWAGLIEECIPARRPDTGENQM